MQSYKTIDEFVATLPDKSQVIAKKLREAIQEAAPQATEAISYGIPTFKLNGKNLVHFSIYAHHIGFYPGAQAMIDFATEFRGYKTSKGTVQFPIEQPIPYELIKEVVKYRMKNI